MMKKIAGFFRRLFASRRFRRGTRILFWVTIAYIILILARILIAFKDAGFSFGEALRFFFSISLFDFDPMWPFIVIVFLAIALGLICYFQGKEENGNTEEEKPVEAPNPVQEEELSEPKHDQQH